MILICFPNLFLLKFCLTKELEKYLIDNENQSQRCTGPHLRVVWWLTLRPGLLNLRKILWGLSHGHIFKKEKKKKLTVHLATSGKYLSSIIYILTESTLGHCVWQKGDTEAKWVLALWSMLTVCHSERHKGRTNQGLKAFRGSIGHSELGESIRRC